MTQDDILRMAREAGIANVFMPPQFSEVFERFAALVAAHAAEREREACAISCEVNAARWIDAGGKQWYAAHECAAAIRARGKT